MPRASICVFLMPMISAVSCFGLSGEEILEKMDHNRDYETVTADASMEIHIGDQVRTKGMRITSLAREEKSIVEFTNPEDEGTRYLMIEDNLWIYFPEEEDVVKISGHMLKEGMMGSDVSYEDALEADKLTDKYEIAVAGEDTLDGRACYVIELNAAVRDAPYFRRKMWVDKEWFIAWKEQMYAKSGMLLKEARVLEVKEIGSRHVPVKSVMENKLRKDSRTIFTMSDIELDAPVDKDAFTMRNLRR